MFTKNNISKRPSIPKLYANTFKAFKKHHILFAPFVIFACLEVLVLIILFLAPRMPFKLIFGPLIGTFWGEYFLHYPFNFLLLPKLTSLARMILLVIAGSLTTGIAVSLAAGIFNKKQPRLKPAVSSATKRYINLFAIILIFTFLYYFLLKLTTAGIGKYFFAGHNKLLFWGPRFWLTLLLPGLNFLIAVLIQAAFAFAIPAAIIDNQKLIRSIIISFSLFKKTFITIFILVALPMLLYVPIMVLVGNTGFLLSNALPEVILLVLLAGIVINSLVIDPLVTVAATALYIVYREKK